jgi:hypothetical protein
MELREALDIVVQRSGHERYRDLCDPEHPDYQVEWPEQVIRMAQEPAPEPAGPGEAPAYDLLALPLAGDLIAEAASRIGIDRLKAWLLARGVDCGCDERQEFLNRADATLRRWLFGRFQVWGDLEMASFEESLLDYTEAKKIRHEFITGKMTLHQIAVKRGLPYSLVKKVVNGEVFRPEDYIQENRPGWLKC